MSRLLRSSEKSGLRSQRRVSLVHEVRGAIHLEGCQVKVNRTFLTTILPENVPKWNLGTRMDGTTSNEVGFGTVHNNEDDGPECLDLIP